MPLKLLCILILCSSAFAAIGDNAPSIPATYVQTHPRLPYPTNAYLNNIWTNRAGGAAYIWTDATAWNSATPGGRVAMRHLLLAYLAEKLNSGPNVATFLAKIQAFSNLSGNWNLTTGSGYWDPSIALAMALDWISADLGATVTTSICSSLDTMASGYEANYGQSSPYNDQFYITGFKQILPMLVAASMYPGCPTGLAHLKFAMDVEINMLWPTWKQVIGGGGYCGSSNNGATDCGGAWHEAWGDYVSKAEGLTNWFIVEPLVWGSASGIGASTFFTSNMPWMKNFAYWTMYQVRPDFTLEPIEPMGIPVFDGENFSSSGYPADIGLNLGMLPALGEIYNDPTLRGWARLVDYYGHVPAGYEPSAWPYFTPDSSSNSANSRASLSTVRNFPGNGRLYVRTGWGENDTSCVLVYRDNEWSHPVQDMGAINCFNRGPLTIRSGSYGPGSASDHFQSYALQAIAQNTLLVYDPSDVYNSETLLIDNNDGSASQVVMPNDGGQRRVGSSISNLGGASLQGMTQSPPDPIQWNRAREFYHQGKLTTYANGSSNKYTFAAVDMTAAYNNLYSRNAHTSSWLFNQANTSNRTFRVQKAILQATFIPRGTAMYVVDYRQIISTNSTFVKKMLEHSINQPVISGNSYTITRNELVTSKPYPDHIPQQWSQGHVGSLGINNCPGGCTTSSTTYPYHGKLYGWMTLPVGGTLTLVGGAGHEFDITDTNGTLNHNKCMQSLFLCTAGNGLGAVSGEVHPDATGYPQQPGSWRIEETVGANNLTDWFINVQLVTSDLDTNVVSTAPTTVTEANGAGACTWGTVACWVTTWKDNADTCTYTLTQPKDGVEGNISVSGAGCTTPI